MMTSLEDTNLTDLLAAKAMGWRATRDRFIKPERGWVWKRKFQPLSVLSDAFRLVEKLADGFTLTSDERGAFTARVRIGRRRGRASSGTAALAFSLAVAQALGLKVEA